MALTRRVVPIRDCNANSFRGRTVRTHEPKAGTVALAEDLRTVVCGAACWPAQPATPQKNVAKIVYLSHFMRRTPASVHPSVTKFTILGMPRGLTKH
jgi:hypothetical protein